MSFLGYFFKKTLKMAKLMSGLSPKNDRWPPFFFAGYEGPLRPTSHDRPWLGGRPARFGVRGTSKKKFFFFEIIPLKKAFFWKKKKKIFRFLTDLAECSERVRYGGSIRSRVRRPNFYEIAPGTARDLVKERNRDYCWPILGVPK